MEKTNNKKYIPVIVILAIALISLAYIIVPQNSEKAVVHLDQFPNQIGEWRGEDIKVDSRTYEILNPDGMIFKEYTNKKGEKVQLVIVVGLNKRESFHPPEVCYSGGGSQVDSKEVITVALKNNPSLQVNRLTAEFKRGSVVQIAYFWFSANDQYFANYYRQQVAIVLNQLKSNKSWGSLIRVSISSNANADKTVAEKSMIAFIDELYPLLPEYINPK